MKLIAGLGNPGERYRFTRHNIGFRVIDQLSRETNIPLTTHRCKSILGSGYIACTEVLLSKPETFMNLSGDAVSEIVSQYQIRHHNIIIVHDDIDLDFGKIKIKAGGGSAGHRGIESIICFLRDDAFTRVRIGVGRPPSGIDGAEFVLQTFTGEEKNQVQDVICRAEKCIEMILTQGTEAAMTVFHRKKVAMAD